MTAIRRIQLKYGDDVQFICTTNMIRSPMAAAVFSRKVVAMKVPFKVTVGSAGLLSQMRGCRAHRLWGALEETREYDMSTHEGRYLGDVKYTDRTLFIAMDDGLVMNLHGIRNVNQERIRMLNPPNGVIDPTINPTAAQFKLCFTQIYTGVDKLLTWIDFDPQ